jgi:hypothetical protein
LRCDVFAWSINKLRILEGHKSSLLVCGELEFEVFRPVEVQKDVESA